MRTVIWVILLSLALFQTSTAKTTPIQFAKGSYCSGFSGNITGQKFAIELGENQIFRVDDKDSVGIASGYVGFSVSVEDLQSRVLERIDNDYDEWLIKKKGVYFVTLNHDNPQNAFAHIEFCAY